MRRIPVPVALLCIFAVSGFSGLIYESIWSHYLKLFLGHAAYSQVLVLVIFMGGLAIGSLVAGHFSPRWKHVLLGYALVEAVTGVIALLFHGAFDRITQASFVHVIPQLGSASAVQAYKWGLGALMLLPQSILLGMTFPLMSAGFVRQAPDAAGRSVSMLYFTNSLGGAIGVLASGFVLIPNFGLPGAIMTAGLLNLIVAFATWLLVKKISLPEPPAAQPVAPSRVPHDRGLSYRFLLFASLVTGMASFCYEIGWLRMLSLVLGASTHAFELMLSSFILGLALGGLWIKRRVERATDPRNLLAVIQVAMGLLALATLFVYGSTFDWMSVVMNTFTRTESGYAGFNWASHSIASLLMLPATFCAGMTLPVITFAALRMGAGERAIGGVYAANTIGAIMGIVLATHVLMPAFSAKGVILAGAAMDFGLGLLLFATMAPPARIRRVAAAAVIGVVAFTFTFLAANVDPLKLTSGVFRYGFSRSSQDEVLYLKDGKTANVSVSRKGSEVSLATNGKFDASINMGPGPAGVDEVTQTLLGALPLMLHSAPKTAAVVGFGSGMTSHTLLLDPGIESVDTIEIEERIIEAARRGFFPRNRQAYEDPRSRIHIEDAKTYFSVANKQYDIIVSEPSNPWVSGISSLFTEEFYRHVSGHLNDGGLLVQWMQLYEIDFVSVASVMKALSPWFQDYAIYIADRDNILIIASKNANLGGPQERAFSLPGLREDLRRMGVLSSDDVRARRVAGKALLDPFFGRSLAPVNSDYFPFIDNRAARARFMKQIAAEPVLLLISELPIAAMLDSPSSRVSWQGLSIQNPSARSLAQLVVRFVIEGQDDVVLSHMRDAVAMARMGAQDCGAAAPMVWQSAWVKVGRFVAPYLEQDQAAAFWSRLLPPRCRERMSMQAQQWYRLLSAVGARDAQAMIDRGGEMLRRSTPDSPARDTYYAAGATILGYLALQETERARDVWPELRERIPSGAEPAMELRWLEAIAIGRLQKQ
ncbi:MAG: spermidine synthase [Prolixibacteraceae bacterium]|nr:spermidine synthase [Burkholderiales bacterium]